MHLISAINNCVLSGKWLQPTFTVFYRTGRLPSCHILRIKQVKQRRAACAPCSGRTSDDCIGGCNRRNNSFNHTWKRRNLMNQKLNLAAEHWWFIGCAHKLFKDTTETPALASSCSYLAWVCKWFQWCWTQLLASEISGTPTECVQDYHHPELHRLHGTRRRLHFSISPHQSAFLLRKRLNLLAKTQCKYLKHCFYCYI